MNNLEDCQIPCLPRFAEGPANIGTQSIKIRLKRSLARPWNYHVKGYLKRAYRLLADLRYRYSGNGQVISRQEVATSATVLKAGDLVIVKSRDEIQLTLDRWKELKGCAFLENMWEYCGTTQRVLQPMERFLDERDYKVKRCKGLVLLEGVICTGTPVFGRCDRCCHLFWREEWLEQVT